MVLKCNIKLIGMVWSIPQSSRSPSDEANIIIWSQHDLHWCHFIPWQRFQARPSYPYGKPFSTCMTKSAMDSLICHFVNHEPCS